MNNNILIHGYFGHSNLGDDLLLKQALEKIPLKYELYILWPKDKDDIAQEFMKTRKFRLLHNRMEILQHRFCMLIYFGGGPFPSTTFSVISLLSRLLTGLTSRRIVLNGVGVVPKPNRRYFDMFMKTVSYCSVRDEMSREFVAKGYPQVVNCGDLYWGASCDLSKMEKLSGKEKRLLVCLANPFSEEEKRQQRIMDRYRLLVRQMARIVSYAKTKGYKVDYLPFFHGSDEKFIGDVQDELKTSDRMLRQNVDYTLDDIDILFRHYDMGICMRFHSVLLAIKNGVPCVGICYDHKTEQLLQEAELSDYGVRYGIRTNQFFGEEIDLDYERLQTIAEMAIKDRQDFFIKAEAFAKKKYESVMLNYKCIFESL